MHLLFFPLFLSSSVRPLLSLLLVFVDGEEFFVLPLCFFFVGGVFVDGEEGGGERGE